MGYFSSEARSRKAEIDVEALKLGGAIGTRAMTRVQRAVFQERSGQFLRTDQRGGETSSACVIDDSLAVLLHAVNCLAGFRV